MATSSAFWSDADYGGVSAGYTLLSKRSPNRYHLMRILRKKGMREIGEVMFTINAENTPSDEASVTMSQVAAQADTTANVQGGVRTIESVNLMGLNLDSAIADSGANTARVTKTGDVTVLNKMVIPTGSRSLRAPGTYATDASGNGGGGKQDSGR